MNLISIDFDGTAGDGDSWILRSCTGLHVESPSVPWTLDNAAIEMAFSERSPRMRTGVVDGIEGPVDIKESNPDSVDFDGLSGPRRNIFYRCDGHKLRHTLIIVLAERSMEQGCSTDPLVT